MEKVIIIRYGEIFLKGKNRDYFESLLIKNIKHALGDLLCEFKRSQGRYFVENFDINDEDEIVDRLKKVFGIYSLSVAYKVQTKADEDFCDIKESLKELAVRAEEDCNLKDAKFRVTVKRADKRIPKASYQIAGELGGVVLKYTHFKVDLTHFDYDFPWIFAKAAIPTSSLT